MFAAVRTAAKGVQGAVGGVDTAVRGVLGGERSVRSAVRSVRIAVRGVPIVIQGIPSGVCTVRFASGSVHAVLERVREVSRTVGFGGPPEVLCGSAPPGGFRPFRGLARTQCRLLKRFGAGSADFGSVTRPCTPS